MRRAPSPLSVTFPCPSRTTSALGLRTLAVACMVIVTGSGPQENVITPPDATAATTACDVQLAGVPFPITWSGWVVLTGWPAAGTAARPVPKLAGACGAWVGVADGRVGTWAICAEPTVWGFAFCDGPAGVVAGCPFVAPAA